MPAFLGMYTRAMNKRFAGRCPRIKVSFVGSFIACRIEDPAGEVSVLIAQEITKALGIMLYQDKRVESAEPMQPAGYHMGGVVANWRRS
jgi:hypothetical protein